MNRFASLVVLALCLSPVCARADNAPVQDVTPAVTDVITIKQGESTRRTFKDVVRVAIGDDAVADIRVPGPDLLVIQGKKVGHTTLMVWTKPNTRSLYDITVTR
jgi:Flp pilus assembly secretin CpaC